LLEKKAAENEQNLKNLQKVYKKIDVNKENPSDEFSNGIFMPKFPDLNIFDKFRIDKFNFMENNKNKNQETPNYLSKDENKIYHKQCEWFSEQKPSIADIEVKYLYCLIQIIFLI
jgi:hypothetical protein